MTEANATAVNSTYAPDDSVTDPHNFDENSQEDGGLQRTSALPKSNFFGANERHARTARNLFSGIQSKNLLSPTSAYNKPKSAQRTKNPFEKANYGLQTANSYPPATNNNNGSDESDGNTSNSIYNNNYNTASNNTNITNNSSNNNSDATNVVTSATNSGSSGNLFEMDSNTEVRISPLPFSLAHV